MQRILLARFCRNLSASAGSSGRAWNSECQSRFWHIELSPAISIVKQPEQDLEYLPSMLHGKSRQHLELGVVSPCILIPPLPPTVISKASQPLDSGFHFRHGANAPSLTDFIIIEAEESVNELKNVCILGRPTRSEHGPINVDTVLLHEPSMLLGCEFWALQPMRQEQ